MINQVSFRNILHHFINNMFKYNSPTWFRERRKQRNIGHCDSIGFGRKHAADFSVAFFTCQT